MKKKTIVSLIGCSFALAFGTFAGLKANYIEEAKAVSSDTQMYIETKGIGDWNDNAVTMVWISGGEQTAKWITASTLVGTIKVYTLPANYTRATVCRFSSSNHPADNSTSWWNDNWGQAYDFDPGDDLNFIQLTGYKDGKAEYQTGYMHHLENGDKLYFTAIKVKDDYSWYDANAKTKIGFWDGTSIVGSRVNNSDLIEFDVASDIYTIGFNIYRLNPADDTSWGQTGDYYYSKTNGNINAFMVTAGDTNEFYDNGCRVFDDTYLAMAYSVHFLNATKGICADEGESADHNSSLSSVWSSLGSIYSSLLNTESKKSAYSSGSEAKIADAKLRYSHIVNRYSGLTDYVGGIRSGSNMILSINNENGANTSIIIVVISTISLVGLGVFFFIKRKKEN